MCKFYFKNYENKLHLLRQNGITSCFFSNLNCFSLIIEWVKEHSKEGSNSAIYQHCSTKGHPCPNVDQFKVIDQEKSQIAREAKEAIHIQKLDPELNRNVGKVVIPHVFDSLFGYKAKKSMRCFITLSGGRISRHWYKPHTISLLCR